jgi:hypothetical protein
VPSLLAPRSRFLRLLTAPRQQGTIRFVDLAPDGPDHLFDENGVDREQIREMLRLAPEQRLRRVEEFVESYLEIRELNEERAVR